MATFDLFRNDGLLDNKQFRRNNSDDSIHKVCVKNGVLTTTLMISCFIGLCALTHSLAINQLSVVNLFMLAFGVYFSLQGASPNGKSGSLDYFEGLKVGLYTSIIAAGIYALFIGVYTSIDSSVLNYINESVFWKFNTSPWVASGIILFEGLASGFVITYCLMQYFKKN